MPSQRIGGVEGDHLLFLDLLVGDFLQALVAEFADQAFVQNVVAERLRRAVARDQRVGKQRDRLVGLVRHLVLDGEQILVVDRDGAAEFEALAVVIGERHRMADGERAGAALRPQRVGRRHLQVGAGGIGPAEFGVERIRAAGRRQQHDRRRFRIDGLAEFDQSEVVDAAAFERDRALQAVGLDRHARRHKRAPRRGWRPRRRATAALARAPARRPGCAGACAGWPGCAGVCVCACCCFCVSCSDCSFSCRAFSCGMAIEILPGDQHDGRQHNGENGVLTVGHRDPVFAVAPRMHALQRPLEILGNPRERNLERRTPAD